MIPKIVILARLKNLRDLYLIFAETLTDTELEAKEGVRRHLEYIESTYQEVEQLNENNMVDLQRLIEIIGEMGDRYFY